MNMDAFQTARLHQLLTWINTHHCGVSPCGVLNADGTITVRVAEVDQVGNVTTVEIRINNSMEARAALGY